MGIVIFLGFLLVCLVAWLVIKTYWNIFEKADKPGWGVLVPLYNIYLWFRIAKFSKKTSILLIILGCTGVCSPITGIALIISAFRIAESFGRTWVFGLLMCLQPYVTLLLLAFDNYEYEFEEDEY